MAYEEFAVTENEAERAAAGRRHMESIKGHIKGLSGKNYQSLYSLNSGHGHSSRGHGPGAVPTDMTAAVHTPRSAQMERMRASVGALYPSPDPTGEFILDPAHIANIAFWLCTDQSWGVNGTMILADHRLSNSWSASPAGIKPTT